MRCSGRSPRDRRRRDQENIQCEQFAKVYIDVSGLSGYRLLLDLIALLHMYATLLGLRDHWQKQRVEELRDPLHRLAVDAGVRFQGLGGTVCAVL